MKNNAHCAIIAYPFTIGVIMKAVRVIGIVLLLCAGAPLRGEDAQPGDLLVASFYGNSVNRYAARTGEFTGSFVDGRGGLGDIGGLTFGPDGLLYIATGPLDYYTPAKVVRYDVQTGAFVSRFVVPGTAGYAYPLDLGFGPDGHLYTTSLGSFPAGSPQDRLLRFDRTTGEFIDVFLDGESGDASGPFTFGPDGQLYLGDSYDHTVHRFNITSGEYIDRFLKPGGGGVGPGNLYSVTDVLFGPDGNFFAFDFLFGLRFDGSSGALIDEFIAYGAVHGIIEAQFGPDGKLLVYSWEGYPLQHAEIHRFDGSTGEFVDLMISAEEMPPPIPHHDGGGLRPGTFVVGPDGKLYVAGDAAVHRYHGVTGDYEKLILPRGGEGGLYEPRGMILGPDCKVYICARRPGGVLRYDELTGTFVDMFISPEDAPLSSHLTMGPDGHMYVSTQTHGIRKFDGATGELLGVFVAPQSGGMELPTDLTFGPDGHLYVSDQLGHRIMCYDGVSGAFLGEFVARRAGGLWGPRALLFGPDGNLYVGSSVTNSVLRYDGNSGEFLGEFVASGSGGLEVPRGLAFGPDGMLYVVSRDTTNVLRFDGQTGEFVHEFFPAGSGELEQPQSILFLPLSLSAGDCDGDGTRDYCELASGMSRDCNANLRPDGCDEGDFDGDGVWNLIDFSHWPLKQWGPAAAPGLCGELFDFDADSDVDLQDLAVFQGFPTH